MHYLLLCATTQLPLLTMDEGPTGIRDAQRHFIFIMYRKSSIGVYRNATFPTFLVRISHFFIDFNLKCKISCVTVKSKFLAFRTVFSPIKCEKEIKVPFLQPRS